LDLVVGRLDARAAGEEEQERRGGVRVVGGLRYVDLWGYSASLAGETGHSTYVYSAKLDDLAGRGLASGWTRLAVALGSVS